VKQLTREQALSKKDRAVHFLCEIVGGDAKADEFDDMDVEDYAAHKHFQIVNPRRNAMPGGNGGNDPRSKAELLDTIDDLEQQVNDLQAALDAVYDIVRPEDGEDDVGDDDGR
jgi:hypothetical protein